MTTKCPMATRSRMGSRRVDGLVVLVVLGLFVGLVRVLRCGCCLHSDLVGRSSPFDERVDEAKLAGPTDNVGLAMSRSEAPATTTHLQHVHDQGEDGHDDDDLNVLAHPTDEPAGEWQEQLFGAEVEEQDDTDLHQREGHEVDGEL